ncbi:MAG: Amidohydrolase 3 [Verrucomicrobiaceae bacterium]|nr:Amidohydrolase 3 [Verrucomicrobiaceae bacterium]
MAEYDLIIRNGTVVDGSGVASRCADVAIRGDRIALIEPAITARGHEEIDATGHLVTPGFVDVHTHYDGQATWDYHLAPSSQLGATTVVIGNCGVGFAPCRPQDRDVLIGLMEGVEDIPGTALAEGLPWDWETFGDYLDALEGKPRDIDIAALYPHGPLRVYVMGERAVNREAATAADIAAMQRELKAGLDAGAVGFSTSRTMIHRTNTGAFTPTYQAANSELKQLGETLAAAPGKVFQMVSDFIDADYEFEIVRHVCARTGAKGTFSLLQSDSRPTMWSEQLARVDKAQAAGLDIRAQVLSRPLGVLMGLNASLTPFSARPTFRALEGLPLPERVAQLRKPAIKAAILNEQDHNPHVFLEGLGDKFASMFPLRDPLEYMPPREQSVAALAEKAGLTPAEWLYDWLLTSDGNTLIYIPSINFTESIPEMLLHPYTVSALGDGGAHVGSICDASAGIYLLTKWVRERNAISIEQGIHMLTRQPAELYSLLDRGLLAPGMKADLNIIDFDGLKIYSPRIVHDLPAGGRRFLQDVDGLAATIVSGEVIYRDGEPTNVLPGRLVRGQRVDPRAFPEQKLMNKS